MIEEALHQPKNKSSQDPINYPIRLNNKLAHLNILAAIGNDPPTQAMLQVRDELVKAIDIQLKALDQLKAQDITELNRRIKASDIDPISIKEDNAK